ncbi:cytochrome c oxidase subunit II [Halomonas salipaludis]|uniref:cytochrome-c oxidase n=1 Tax=Halomonas salipaludis TaxID=2032625 RepID=A0A2A2ES21_9GAMM|nr:cytochrome c oxidase subunit II [Halomonas salipaludis]PAU76231.1 cytochrome c oxidase subunit II [Halomonas salipaludis]
MLVGCSGDRSILDPAGQAAREVAWLWWGMLAFSTVVLVVITALWLYAFRGGRRVARSSRDEQRIARRWIIGGGLLLPGLSIVLLLAFGVPVGQRMLPLPLPDGQQVERIEVTGHQWWWEVRYPDAEGGEVVTSNQLMMPVGEPVDFHVTGADVIHAFWIPRLGGKIDMIPGRTNVIRLEADASGVFGAQCAEFCGAQHTNMQLHVEAMPRDDFNAWLAERQAPPEQSDDHQAARDTFVEHCASCHRVAGVSDGQQGPDLSDIGDRVSLGAGRLAMEEGAIAHWLRHHQQLKPGNRMPSHDHLDAETLDALGAWLETLSP